MSKLRMTALLAFATLGFIAVPPADAQNWGAVKGRLAWGPAELPKVADLEVSKDKEHCLKNGPIKNDAFVVDPSSRGVKDAFVYLRFKSKPAIHPSYPQTAKEVEAKFFADFKKLNGFGFDELKSKVASGSVKVDSLKAPVMLDQLQCVYVPKALAVREGMPLLALNPEPIAHNVKVTSLSGKNDANPIMPAHTFEVFKWTEEKSLINLECSIHGWMRAYAMVFDHPYYAVTDSNGAFLIENIPAGSHEIAIRHGAAGFVDPLKGGKGNARGGAVVVKPGGVVDLGDIKLTP